jgi:hypothetical protein
MRQSLSEITERYVSDARRTRMILDVVLEIRRPDKPSVTESGHLERAVPDSSDYRLVVKTGDLSDSVSC